MADALAIYVHWPFCLSKCPYCDFNSHVRERIDEARWREALLRELDHDAERTRGRRVASIFFGGGTPSLMSPATAERVIAHVAKRWRVEGDIEITLEANPNSAESARFRDFRSAGVNRVSIGVQALDDAALRGLGRAHDAIEARAAVAAAARIFARYSFDLIYARPAQSLVDWRAELDDALSLAGDHLSLYQLTIEEGTRFAQLHARGSLDLPDSDLAAALFDLTQERLDAHGMPAYEISNHARRGAESRHNLTYWRYGDYVGAGPGAHGRLTRDGRKLATRGERAPETWMAAVERVGHGRAEETPLAPDEAASEALLMGLRLIEGVDAARFAAMTGRSLAESVDGLRLARLVAGGLVIQDAAGGIRATGSGRRVLNAVIAELAGGAGVS
jgi:oxygen-independent coproporphyrinogen-3 oxidase